MSTTQKFCYEGVELDLTLTIGEDGVETPKHRDCWRKPLLVVISHLTGYCAGSAPKNDIIDAILTGFGLTRDSKFARKLGEQ